MSALQNHPAPPSASTPKMEAVADPLIDLILEALFDHHTKRVLNEEMEVCENDLEDIGHNGNSAIGNI